MFPQDIDSKDFRNLCQVYSNIPIPLPEWHGACVFLKSNDELFLIRRSETMPSHKGHLAFPGGKREKNETPIETALRELNEETGLQEHHVDIVGLLPPVYSSPVFLLLSVLVELNISKNEFNKSLKPNCEWSEAMWLRTGPLEELNSWSYAMRFGTQTIGSILFRDLSPSERITIRYDLEAPAKSYLLWGATARLVWNYLRIHKNK